MNKKGVATTIHSAPQRSAFTHHTVQPHKAHLPSAAHLPPLTFHVTHHPASKSVAAQVNPGWWSAVPHPLPTNRRGNQPAPVTVIGAPTPYPSTRP
ncbi:MAG TPA: hypothetical protein VJ183_00430 [Chloroflexia bacterium]|nr:hypothetical protein [Chloroflexia bacterium]